ncbi:MAG: PLDc N-terminal domain-containing protein, partial [Prevotellaceae bacterium]|nr:PLDc N-terminal domain-containing protein [Prevotellaceae bacterium]
MLTPLFDLNMLAGAAYLLTLVAIGLVVLQQRGDPTKTLAWMLFIAFVPVVGLVFYALIGKSYRRDKILSRKESSDQQQLAQVMALRSVSDDYLGWFPSSPSERHFRGIAQLLAQANKTFPTRSNHAQLL